MWPVVFEISQNKQYNIIQKHNHKSNNLIGMLFNILQILSFQTY